MTSSLRFVCAGILLLGASLPVAAQTAAPPIGRLFFSPEKRAALERQRQLNVQAVRTLEGETLILNGVVQSSAGRRTVWINRRAQTEADEAASGLGVRTNPRNPGVAEIVTGDQDTTRLKVGESINRATGDHDTRLRGGIVQVRPAR